ncbi:MAG: hypothetical protein H7039_24900 [Bryobacteraceae bacterium]|nr:hypothetical protein [Bryobacteraceae bacterium]
MVAATAVMTIGGRVLLRNNDRTRVLPGSTLKPLVAVCLLEQKAAAPVRCSGQLMIGGRNLRCTHPRPSGAVDLGTAIAWSCNEYFAVAALRVQPRQLAVTLRRLSLDVRTPQTPEQLQRLALGNWGIQCLALDLGFAYRRLAIEAPARVREALREAAIRGTAQLARPPQQEICGKTGTGEFALFAGWSPAEDPKTIVSVITPGGRGAIDAAPVARTLFERFS